MNTHAKNKAFVAAFFTQLSQSKTDEVSAVVSQFCHGDVTWDVVHPFNTLRGSEEIARELLIPLREAFPDYEHRLSLIIGGEYEGRNWVSTLGHIMGSFFRPWLNIPATYALTYLRFGVNAVVENGKITKARVFLDIVDVMRQGGLYPFRRMPGSAEMWPAPPVGTGVSIDSHDAKRGEESLRIIREMQVGLGHMDLKDLQNAEYSELWHPNKNWYGPAGIGSTRGKRGFREYHGRLFLQGFPDRKACDRDHDGPLEGQGHYIRIGDGNLAVTSGWPSIRATHLGDGWMGLAPTGRRVEMRVADWYRVDENNLIIDNWVAIDVLHILYQMGMDVLRDMEYFADPTKRRWPDPE